MLDEPLEDLTAAKHSTDHPLANLLHALVDAHVSHSVIRVLHRLGEDELPNRSRLPGTHQTGQDGVTCAVDKLVYDFRCVGHDGPSSAILADYAHERFDIQRLSEYAHGPEARRRRRVVRRDD